MHPGVRGTAASGFRRHIAPIVILLMAVGLSCAKGFIDGVLAYERDTTVFYYPLLVWASQQLHSGQLGPLSARADTFPYSEVAGQSFTPFGVAQLLFPFVFRGPGHDQWGLWTHWEAYLYVGVAPLLLSLVAMTRARRPPIVVWVVIGLFGLVVALGEYSPVDLFALLWRTPGLGWLRAPGRFELIVVLALSMLAAHGTAMLQRRARIQRGKFCVLPRLSVVLTLLLAPFVIAFMLSVLHSALLAEDTVSLALIQSHYLAAPHDQQPVTPEDVYAGLLRTTDLSEPRVAGALLALFVTLATIVLWQMAPWPRVRRSSGWLAVLFWSPVQT